MNLLRVMKEPIQRSLGVLLIGLMLNVCLADGENWLSPKEMQQRMGLGINVINTPLTLFMNVSSGKSAPLGH